MYVYVSGRSVPLVQPTPTYNSPCAEVRTGGDHVGPVLPLFRFDVKALNAAQNSVYRIAPREAADAQHLCAGRQPEARVVPSCLRTDRFCENTKGARCVCG